MYKQRMENSGKYIALILLLVCSCRTIDKKNVKKENKIKQKYLNGLQFGDKKTQKKYEKKFYKLRH